MPTTPVCVRRYVPSSARLRLDGRERATVSVAFGGGRAGVVDDLDGLLVLAHAGVPESLVIEVPTPEDGREDTTQDDDNLGSSIASFVWGLLAERGGYGAVLLPASALGAFALYVLVSGGFDRTPRPISGV